MNKENVMQECAQEGPCRLLVVDDESIVGKRLRQVFSKMGFEIETFTEAAPAMAAMAERPFDIVVTDLKMEDMDGMEVLRQVRRMHPATRVIIITGYADEATAESARKLGVFAFLAKPFRLDILKDMVFQALADKRREEARG
jgi:DNA-binding NtrC family response regulator